MDMSVKKASFISVERFYVERQKELRLRLIAGNTGMNRRIKVPDINRPGLALFGYFDYFPDDRVQVMGNSEISYLRSLSSAARERKITRLFQEAFPCLIISRRLKVPDEIRELSDQESVPTFSSPRMTSRLVSGVVLYLDEKFAPVMTTHGSLLEVYGVGVLITGPSGVGKSECAIGLIGKGHRLVADDLVFIKVKGEGELLGYGKEDMGHYLEVRGLGIIDVERLYGISAIRQYQKIDMMIGLEFWDEQKEYDRLGLGENKINIMGIGLNKLVLPVRPGRDIITLIELAAMNQRLKDMGHNPVEELDKKLKS